MADDPQPVVACRTPNPCASGISVGNSLRVARTRDPNITDCGLAGNAPRATSARPGFRPRAKRQAAHNQRALCLYAQSALPRFADAGCGLRDRGAQLVDRRGHDTDVLFDLRAGNRRRRAVPAPDIPRIWRLCASCTANVSAAHGVPRRTKRLLFCPVLEAPRIPGDPWL